MQKPVFLSTLPIFNLTIFNVVRGSLSRRERSDRAADVGRAIIGHKDCMRSRAGGVAALRGANFPRSAFTARMKPRLRAQEKITDAICGDKTLKMRYFLLKSV